MSENQEASRGGIGTQPPAPIPPAAGTLTDDEKLWGMLAHLSVLLTYVTVIPFANLVGPAIVYFAYKDKSKFVRFHAIQTFVFQLGLTIFISVMAIPIFILTVLTFGLLAVFLALVWLLLLVWIIYMGIQANKGEHCMYVLVGTWAYRKVYEEDWKPL